MSPLRPLRRNWLAVLLIGAGVLVLGIDRFVLIPGLRMVADRIYEWALLLAAFAVLLGVLNVGWVHLRQIVVGSAGWQMSLALLAALLAVLASGVFSPDGVYSPLMEWFFDSIIAPGQATLFALLAFFMAAAAYRYLRIGRAGGTWMLAGALLVLAVQMPLTNVLVPARLITFTEWLLTVPAMAAVRGALLGSAFALLIVAFRFLTSYR